MKRGVKKEKPRRGFLWWIARIGFSGVVILFLASLLIDIFVSDLDKHYDYQSDVTLFLCWFSGFTILFSLISLAKRKMVRAKDWLFPAIAVVFSIAAFVYAFYWLLTHGVAQ